MAAKARSVILGNEADMESSVHLQAPTGFSRCDHTGLYERSSH